jgi:predicted TIM-barrel fold metal-dependent hydrolase
MIIDEHRHIGYAASHPARTAEDIVAELDELHVDCAVIVAGEKKPLTREEELASDEDTGPAVEEYLQTGLMTDQIASLHQQVYDQSMVFDAVEAHKGRLFGGYILNPWLVDTEFDKAREAIKKYGLRYIKLHPWTNAFAPDNKDVMGPVVDLAVEFDLPLWFHTSYGPGTEPERMARLAETFPKVRVILGHGLCGSDGAKVAAIVESHEDIWVDFALASEEAMRKVIQVAPEDRMMLASDDPWGLPSNSLSAQIEKSLRVTEARPRLRTKIMGGNAMGLLKICR